MRLYMKNLFWIYIMIEVPAGFINYFLLGVPGTSLYRGIASVCVEKDPAIMIYYNHCKIFMMLCNIIYFTIQCHFFLYVMCNYRLYENFHRDPLENKRVGLKKLCIKENLLLF